MKRITQPIILVFFLVCMSSLFAQNEHNYLSDGMRSYAANPASIGTLNKVSVSNRLNFTPYQFDTTPANFQMNGAFKCINIGGVNQSKIRGAIGFKADYKRSYSIWKMGVTAQFNLQFDLGNSFLSVGLAPRIENVAYPEYSFGCFSSTIVFPIFPPKHFNFQNKYILDGGVYWFNERFNLGFSTSNLLQEKTESNSDYRGIRMFHLQGAYEHLLTGKIRLKGVFNSQLMRSNLNIMGMVYAIMGKREISIGMGFDNERDLLGGASIRIKDFSLGCFVRYNLSGLNPTKYSMEYRVAYDLFDVSFQSFKSTENLSF